MNIGAGDKQSSGRASGQRDNHNQNEDGGGNREKLGGIRCLLDHLFPSNKIKYISFSSFHPDEKYFVSI